MNDYGKIPPQELEIEKLLLGELIQFPEVMDEVITIISVDDFYANANQVIFAQLYYLWSEGKKIDLQIVTARLKKTDQLKDVGGIMYVTKLLDSVMHSASVKEHAYIVKEASVKRQFISMGSSINSSAYSNESDIDHLLTLSNSELDAITDNIFKSGDTMSFKAIVDGTINDYYERKKKAEKGEFTGIRAPIYDLNKYTGGWQPGDLIIIAGRPSMGKTAFAVQCAVTATRTGSAVDIYTLEMTSRQFTQRIMSCTEDINIEKFRTGMLTVDEEKLMENSVNKMLKLSINLDDKSGITAEYIKAKSSSTHRKGRCDLIIVDYLQLMSYDNKLNSNEGYGSITRKLKGLAKDLDIPVILLSQLNRDLEKRGNKRPMLSDLRSSGEIEQDADLVIFPYRHHYYSGQEDDEGLVELIIAKHRNGRTGIIDAGHNETITKFFDVDKKHEYHEEKEFAAQLPF